MRRRWLISVILLFTGITSANATTVSPVFVNAVGKPGVPTHYPNGFNSPHDLTLSPDGKKLYVADTNNNLVQVFLADSLLSRGVIGRGQLNSPHDVTFDQYGRLLVADSGNNRIIRYDVTNILPRFINELKRGFNSPEGVAMDQHGRLFVVNTASHKLMLFINDKPVLIKQQGGYGNALGHFSRPHDIAVSNDGQRVYVADASNHRIQILNGNLVPQKSLGGEAPYNFNQPKYLAVDEAGWLYVADQYNHQVKIYTPQYELAGIIGNGRPGREENRLNGPEGVVARGGEVWISDTHNHRIVHYRLNGWHP